MLLSYTTNLITPAIIMVPIVMADPQYDVIISGQSVGPIRIDWTGTISAVVVQGESKSPKILSCWHVLAYDDKAKVGDEICQPLSSRKVVAQLTNKVRGNSIEVALAEILDPATAAPGIQMYDGNVIPFTKFADEQSIKSLIDAHGHVRKSGVTSHLTSGKIVAGDVKAPIGYPDTPMGWEIFGQIVIESDTPGSLFSKKMDSGAPIINDSNEIIGILIGGDDKYSYATPINFIQNQMKVSPWNS